MERPFALWNNLVVLQIRNKRIEVFLSRFKPSKRHRYSNDELEIASGKLCVRHCLATERALAPPPEHTGREDISNRASICPLGSRLD